MFSILTALAATIAIQTAPAAPPKAFENLPGTKVHYYDVSGRTGAAIRDSLNKVIKTEKKTAGQLFTWTVAANIEKQTDGNACTISSAKALLDANVYLPRLTEESRVPSEDLVRWNAYESGLEKAAADNLQFVAQRLPAIEQSLVGKPCDDVAALWDKSIKELIEQQQAYDRKHHPEARNTDFRRY